MVILLVILVILVIFLFKDSMIRIIVNDYRPSWVLSRCEKKELASYPPGFDTRIESASC